MTLQATETLQNGPFKGIFDEDGAFVGFLNPRANGADLRIGGYAPVSGSFTTLTVSGQSSFAAGSAAAPSVKAGGEQNGLYSDGAGSLSFATAGARVVRMGTVGGTGNYLRLDANNTPMVTAVAGATNADIGIASAGTGSVLLATNGSINNLQARVTHTASAVNYWQLTGSSTGSAVWLDVRGSDSNVSALYSTKGTGSHTFASGNSATTQFVVNHTASAVNYYSVNGGATGVQPGFAATGSDANVSSAFSTKGTGYHYFSTNSFADVQFVIASVPSAVNRLQVQGGTAGFGPTIYVDGADTNTQLTISSKGTGSVLISTNTAGSIALQALHVASAVNWVRVQGSATGVASFVSVQGADTNASIVVAAKGSGAVGLYTGGGVVPQVLVSHTASAVNYLNFTGAATGGAVTISTGGSDTNRSLSLTAAGTGLVQITNDSLRIVTSKTPASAAATGTQGQISWDADYIYVCTATDTWKRAALATW